MAEGDPRFEMNRLVSYDDTSIVNEIRRVAALLPDGPITRKAFDAQSRVSSSAVIRRFGGWQDGLTRAGLGDRYGGKRVSAKMRDQRARAATREDMIAELQRIAEKMGRRVITRADLLEHSDLMSERALINRFGTWKAAVEAAGLELSNMARRWTDSDYFENLLVVWAHYGRSPSYDEMNRPPSRITGGAYAARFSSWGKAKLAFVERVNAAGDEGDCIATAPVAPMPTVARPKSEDRRQIPIGLRFQVLRRDRFRCVACGRSPATDISCVLHVDHVTPFSRGGKTRPENLRALCATCNVGKGASEG